MSINEDDSKKAFDAKTMIAIVLMVIVITAGMAVQSYFFPKQPLPVEPTATTTQTVTVTPGTATVIAEQGQAPLSTMPTVDAPAQEIQQELSTNLFDAVFTNRGGELVSLRLKKHLDSHSKEPVDLILPGAGGAEAFAVAFGGASSVPLDTLMTTARPAPGVIEFSAAYSAKNAAGENVPFVLKKRYEFKDGDYMFRLSVSVEGEGGSVPKISDGQYAYTMTFGPQIGPSFSGLPKNADFRKVITYEGGKRKVSKNGTQVSDRQASWSAIAGKYFTVIVRPGEPQYTATYVNTAADGFPVTSSMSFSRAASGSGSLTDVFYVYAGPKSSKELARYDDPTANAFKLSGNDFEAVLEGNNMLGWLEWALKWCLNLFYGIVHNYGIAIILVTLLVRVIMFPLTFKGSQSTARMAELQPKIQEMQAKYKNNPQKLNQEMAEFYKKEGYNPLSGCLPLLIQFPIFIAMYSLFNNHFDLRGASFIAGWINDLSLPEAVYTFPTINMIIWRVSAIRILPIVYVLSQLAYGRFMQQPASGGQSAGQMKFMMYGMPIMFFFILYDVPSGLLVYWIASNILTTLQQIVINRVIHKKRAVTEAAAAAAAPKGKVISGKGGKGVKKGRN